MSTASASSPGRRREPRRAFVVIEGVVALCVLGAMVTGAAIGTLVALTRLVDALVP